MLIDQDRIQTRGNHGFVYEWLVFFYRVEQKGNLLREDKSRAECVRTLSHDVVNFPACLKPEAC